MTERKRPARDNRDKVRMVKDQGRKAITASRNIDMRVKSTTLFLYLPDDATLTLQTKTGTIEVPLDEVIKLDIIGKEPVDDAETHQTDNECES